MSSEEFKKKVINLLEADEEVSKKVKELVEDLTKKIEVEVEEVKQLSVWNYFSDVFAIAFFCL